MEMSYDGALVMPSSYALMSEEEMCYIEGGRTATVTGTAKKIRSILTQAIGASLTGTAAATIIGTILGGAVGGVISAIVAGQVFVSYISAAKTAHSQVEDIISKYSGSIKCKLKSTYTLAIYCTGMNVSLA